MYNYYWIACGGTAAPNFTHNNLDHHEVNDSPITNAKNAQIENVTFVLARGATPGAFMFYGRTLDLLKPQLLLLNPGQGANQNQDCQENRRP
jgi:hypothetical protein